ncbi:LolA family protein [Bacillus benzoevorans]|uniref:Outer membrane lipoprotein-sorting protein n=1 Tax=Bacillus benzoevorans TaxID=1456 RepID=A0A7X0HVI7_9BACI|nr:outer membrane lipoprotein carrier protein LolA [Bacillus benzoevorans]MBB6447667.1 outer membrane lipoprotein-sorting protein [Bacillus benzoevorans]
MKKRLFMLLALLLAVLLLAACGEKSQTDVVKTLEGKLDKLAGYKVKAKMTLQMGSEPHTYDVEIWHKRPDFYRVDLKNAQKDQSQMILRNDEGVFVLTPALNKSFKFQSDWPQNSSQAYLFESLAMDIIEDKEAKFTATKDHYVFETKTRYQNNRMLPYQEITLSKKDLAPVSVKVMDTDRNALVTVEFTDMKFDANFDNKDFDMQKNMTGAQLDKTVMAELGDSSFTVKYPEETAGASLKSEKEVKMEDGKQVVLTYEGEKSFTLVQEKTEILPATAGPMVMTGELVDLGFTIGAVTDNSLTWTYEGVDYMIASNDLTPKEMVEIAQTVQAEAVK